MDQNHVQRMLPSQSLQPIHSSAKLEPAAAREGQLALENHRAFEQMLCTSKKRQLGTNCYARCVMRNLPLFSDAPASQLALAPELVNA